MKNSSRLEEKIEQNLTRSSSGCDSSAARSRTRALNSTHESSRLRRRESAVRVRVGIASNTIRRPAVRPSFRRRALRADVGAERVDQLPLEVRDQALRLGQQV